MAIACFWMDTLWTTSAGQFKKMIVAMFNLFVNQKTNSPIHEFKVLHKRQRAL